MKFETILISTLSRIQTLDLVGEERTNGWHK